MSEKTRVLASKDYGSQARSVLSFLRNRGHPIPVRPSDIDNVLSLKRDVTKMTLEQLGRRYQKVISAAAYARRDLVTSEVTLRNIRRDLLVIEAMEAEKAGEKTPQWRVKNLCLRNKRWRKLDQLMGVEEAKKRFLEIIVESLDRQAMLLSREITRRQTEWSQTND